MDKEAIAFIDALKEIDSSLWAWAEVRLDAGDSLDLIKAELKAALRIVERERA